MTTTYMKLSARPSQVGNSGPNGMDESPFLPEPEARGPDGRYPQWPFGPCDQAWHETTYRLPGESVLDLARRVLNAYLDKAAGTRVTLTACFRDKDTRI